VSREAPVGFRDIRWASTSTPILPRNSGPSCSSWPSDAAW